MRTSASLKSLLEIYRARLPEEQFSEFSGELIRIMNDYVAALSAMLSASDRARSVHSMIDELIDTNRPQNTGCKKGCAACCHFKVEITSDEASLLAESVRNGVQIDRLRLRELAEREHLDSEWSKGILNNNRCIFLTADNTCATYKNRPAVCRKLLVTSAPIHCEMENGTPETVAMPLAEIALNAAINVQGNNFGPMAKMLLLALEES